MPWLGQTSLAATDTIESQRDTGSPPPSAEKAYRNRRCNSAHHETLSNERGPPKTHWPQAADRSDDFIPAPLVVVRYEPQPLRIRQTAVDGTELAQRDAPSAKEIDERVGLLQLDEEDSAIPPRHPERAVKRCLEVSQRCRVAEPLWNRRSIGCSCNNAAIPKLPLGLLARLHDNKI